MKIECIKDKLLEVVQKAEKVTGKNLTLPILSCLSLEAIDSKLIVRATNLDIGVELSIPVKVIKPGSTALPASILLQFLSNLSHSEKISLELEEGFVSVKTEHSSTVIKTHNNEEFPVIPGIGEGQKSDIDIESFIQGLRSVWYSSAVSSMKPELASVYVYKNENNLVFVATDSFRLAEKRIPIKEFKDFSSILIPFKNVSEIIRLLEGVKKNVSFSVDGSQISFSWDGSYLVSRIIEGSFPDYTQLIPKEAKTEATVLKQDLIQALKLANVFSDTFNQLVVRIVPGEKLFEITTRNNDVGENKNTIEAIFRGEDVTLSFNYKYVVDCFQSIPVDSVTLSFNGTGRPLIIRGVSDTTFTYLVMPMNK
jgi:DNA polymerase-3 subunit beta